MLSNSDSMEKAVPCTFEHATSTFLPLPFEFDSDQMAALRLATDNLRQHWLCRLKALSFIDLGARTVMGAFIGSILGSVGGYLLGTALGLGAGASCGIGLAGSVLFGVAVFLLITLVNRQVPLLRKKLVMRLYPQDYQTLKDIYEQARTRMTPEQFKQLKAADKSTLLNAEEIYYNIYNIELYHWHTRRSKSAWMNDFRQQ